MSNVINLSCSHHAMLLYNDYSERELASINYINQGLREKQLCIYASVDAYDTSHYHIPQRMLVKQSVTAA
jgi:hypothetical protein